jgi:hypothetical protein
MDIINEANFLQYLKRNYPYLYNFEMEVRRIAKATGFGDVSVSCIIRHHKVFSSDVLGAIKTLYSNQEEGNT